MIGNLCPRASVTALLKQTASGAFLFLIFFLFAMGEHQAFAAAPKNAPRYSEMTYGKAKQWCDTVTLRFPEGIYLFQERGCEVLVRPVPTYATSLLEYELVVVRSMNPLLPPGQVIGYLSPGPDRKRGTLQLYTDIKFQRVRNPKKYAATLDASACCITFLRPSRRLSINPLGLIPRLRSVMRVSESDHMKELPSGMLRVYPPLPPDPSKSPLFPLYF